MVAGASAETSAAGSVTCRHSGSRKENRRKRADGLRIKSHTGKIHADVGLMGRGASSRRQGSFSRRASGRRHGSLCRGANLGQQAASYSAVAPKFRQNAALGAGKHAAAQINHGRHNRQQNKGRQMTQPQRQHQAYRQPVSIRASLAFTLITQGLRPSFKHW